MKMFVAGEWVDGANRLEVRNPFDNSVVDTVPKATPEDVERALAGAVEGARIMRKLPGYDRAKILRKAAELMGQQTEKLGRLISTEEGKILAEGIFEVSRARETIELSAEEARRIGGEVLPLDGAPGGAGKLGFTLRVPCGIVAAITPFNFPLNLVCHKMFDRLRRGCWRCDRRGSARAKNQLYRQQGRRRTYLQGRWTEESHDGAWLQ